MHRRIAVPLLAAVAAIPPFSAFAQPLVAVSLEATNLSGTPITSIPAGGSFHLEAIIQDIRNPPPSYDGVFAGYLNVTYNPALVTIVPTATITYGPTFTPSLTPSGDLSTPGQINEIGVSSESFASPGNAPQLLWAIIPATATLAGIEIFVPSFDSTPGHDTLLYGDDSAVPASQISFIGATLTVVPEPSSMILACLAAGLAVPMLCRRVYGVYLRGSLMWKSLAVFPLAAFAALTPLSALAQPVTMAWSPVGNAGNAPDPATGSLYGAVPYNYSIGTYDVTVNQYVAFLNAKVPLGESATRSACITAI